MKMYCRPVFQFLTIPVYLKTQATGASTNQTPSDPSFDCLSAVCNSDIASQYFLDLIVTWTDETGTAVSSYTVVIELGGSNFSLTDATTSCSISETTPAGTYELSCDNTLLSGIAGTLCGCSAPSDMTVVSISDGVNTLSVTGATCSSVLPEQGC